VQWRTLWRERRQEPHRYGDFVQAQEAFMWSQYGRLAR
jgi:hypothetical protein